MNARSWAESVRMTADDKVHNLRPLRSEYVGNLASKVPFYFPGKEGTVDPILGRQRPHVASAASHLGYSATTRDGRIPPGSSAHDRALHDSARANSARDAQLMRETTHNVITQLPRLLVENDPPRTTTISGGATAPQRGPDGKPIPSASFGSAVPYDILVPDRDIAPHLLTGAATRAQQRLLAATALQARVAEAMAVLDHRGGEGSARGAASVSVSASGMSMTAAERRLADYTAARARRRGVDIISNRYTEGGGRADAEHKARDAERARETAVRRYWQSRNLDPVTMTFCDPAKEEAYQAGVRASEAIQGRAARERLPPSTSASLGQCYDIVGHRQKDAETLELVDAMAARPLRRFGRWDVESRQGGAGDANEEYGARRSLSRARQSSYVHSVDPHGFDVLTGHARDQRLLGMSSAGQASRPAWERISSVLDGGGSGGSGGVGSGGAAGAGAGAGGGAGVGVAGVEAVLGRTSVRRGRGIFGGAEEGGSGLGDTFYGGGGSAATNMGAWGTGAGAAAPSYSGGDRGGADRAGTAPAVLNRSRGGYAASQQASSSIHHWQDAGSYAGGGDNQ